MNFGDGVTGQAHFARLLFLRFEDRKRALLCHQWPNRHHSCLHQCGKFSVRKDHPGHHQKTSSSHKITTDDILRAASAAARKPRPVCPIVNSFEHSLRAAEEWKRCIYETMPSPSYTKPKKAEKSSLKRWEKCECQSSWIDRLIKLRHCGGRPGISEITATLESKQAHPCLTKW